LKLDRGREKGVGVMMPSTIGLTILICLLSAPARFDGSPASNPLSSAQANTIVANREARVSYVPGKQRRLTLDDNGAKVNLRVGDQLLVALGGDWDWTLESFDTAILKNVTSSKNLPKDAQALLEAKRAGQTELSLTGDPPCQKSRPPCNVQSRRFHVTITVQ
jgi:hypothetical protein